VAGRRAGLAGARSGLWHEFRRIVTEFTPEFVEIENVPGLLSSNGGRDFLTVIRGLEELGYSVAWTVLDSQYRGVAQRRERVFIIGSLGNGSCAEILFEPESVRGDTPPSREKRESATRDVALCLNSGRDGYNDGSDQTYISSARMTAFGEYVDDGSASTLKERDYKDATDLVVGFSSKDHGADAQNDKSPTLRSMNFDKSHIDGGGQAAIVQWASGGGKLENPSAQALRAGAEHNYQFARVGMSVRRLTPRECERLQGFPDDWTRWDQDGKEISDSARYRMLGNAVTVPVARWLGERMLMTADRCRIGSI
jgi:DNA (cytosine-5)-methyltransferase 1